MSKKYKKDKTSKKQSASGGGPSLSEAPVVADKNRRVRGGFRNMSLRTTVDQTRSAFPYMLELDLIGVKSTDLGLSPEFQEVLQNARDGDLTSAEIFAPYTVTPTNTETVLRRIGAARPFSDTALSGKAFHTNNHVVSTPSKHKHLNADFHRISHTRRRSRDRRFKVVDLTLKFCE